jgi:acetyl esterase
MHAMDKQTEELLAIINADPNNLIPLENVPVAEFRSDETLFYQRPNAHIKEVINISIDGPIGPIPLRIYIPHGNGPFATFVTFHGGGWVWGSLNSHDGLCRDICEQANVIVVSVEYHRAPEHPFPAPLNDCYAATQWAAHNIAPYNGKPQHLIVGGDSAGGNLSAAVALMARDKKENFIKAQVLLYPVLHYAFDTPSYKENAEGYFLTKQNMQWFWKMYLGRESTNPHYYASPLHAPTFADLPPALIIVAQFDPLRDEGIAYANALKNAGVESSYTCYSTIHCFMSFANGLEIGKRALKEAAAYIKEFAND